ncbi:MAG: hypothetical protein RBQ97_06640 [Acholeplasma sp.]|nr:hypothetical protein [Acholeplasma sp.]
MRRKNLFFLLFFLIIMLVSCQKIDHEYSINVESFESFYQIDVEIKKEGSNYNYAINVLPHIEFENTESKVEMKVYFKYENDIKIDLTTKNVSITLPQEKPYSGIYDSKEFGTITLFYIEVTSAKGEITSNSEIDIVKKVYEVPAFNKEIKNNLVDDVEKNKSIMNELQEKMVVAGNEMSLASFLTVDVSVENKVVTSNNTSSEDSHVQTRITDNYLEISDGLDKHVYLNKSSRIFYYPILEDERYENVYYIEPEVITLGDYEELVNEQELNSSDFEYDYAKVLFEKITNGYQITGFVKDLVPKDEYQGLKELFAMLGLDSEMLEEFIVVLKVTFSDNGFSIKNLMRFDINMSHVSYIDITTTQSYSYSEFEIIDLDSDLYKVATPNAIEKVTEETNFLEDVNNDSYPNPHFYLSYLKKGQYHHEEVNDLRLTMYFYDSEGQEINADLLSVHGFYYEENNYFIPEDGYYYIKIKGNTSALYDGYSVKLVKEDYETLYDPYNPISLSLSDDNEITIEGKNDFVAINYVASEYQLLEVKTSNVGVDISLIYRDHYSQNNGSIYFMGDKEIKGYLEVKKGDNNFLIKGSGSNLLTFTVEKVELDQSNYVTELDKMKEITTEFSDLIYTSHLIGYAYLRLELISKSVISFEVERGEQLPTSGIYILNSKLENITYMHAKTKAAFEPGTYVVKLLANDYLGANKIKVVIEEYQNKTQTVQLPRVTKPGYFTEGVLKIESVLYDSEQHEDIYFTLEDEEIIFVYASDFAIYDQNDKVIVPWFSEHQAPSSGTYYKFAAGTYYLRQYNHKYSSERKRNIGLSIIDGEIVDDYIAGTSRFMIELNKEYSFLGNNEYDTEMVFLKIVEAGYYSYNTRWSIMMKKEDGTDIVLDNNQVYLDKGIYMIYLNVRTSNDYLSFYRIQ